MLLISFINVINTLITFFFSTRYLKKDILDPIPYIILINWLYFPCRIFFLIVFDQGDLTRSVHFLEAYDNINILYTSTISLISLVIIIFFTNLINFSEFELPVLFNNKGFRILSIHFLNYLVLLILFLKVSYGFTHYFGNNLINLTSFLNKILSYFGSLGPITYIVTIYLILEKKFQKFLDWILVLNFLFWYLLYYIIFGGLDGIMSIILPIIFFQIKNIKLNINKFIFLSTILFFTLYIGLILKKFFRVYKGNHDNTDISFSLFDYFIQLSNRFHGADSFIVLLHRLNLKETTFQLGEMFYLFFAGLIPRIFWVEKPEISLGNTFNDIIWKPDIAELIGYGHQSTAMLLQTEFYWNFSIIGIPIGYAFYILIIQILKKFLYNDYKINIYSLAFLSYSFPSIIRHEYSLASFLHGLIFMIIYFSIYYFLTSKKS